MEHWIDDLGAIPLKEAGQRRGVRAINDMVGHREFWDLSERGRDLFARLQADWSFGVGATHEDRDASGFKHCWMVA